MEQYQGALGPGRELAHWWSLLVLQPAPRAGLVTVGDHLVSTMGSNLGGGASVHLFEDYERLLTLAASLGVDVDSSWLGLG